jgi:hypothetical protein
MKMKHSGRHFHDEDVASFEKRKKKKYTQFDQRNEKQQRLYQGQRENGFTCIQCNFPVSVEREVSGVKNRNHCPRCLFSRHVDEFKAGDRKANCKSRMEPVGLTLKQTPKRYGGNQQGELMLIHCCKGCGKISINRIAADDDVEKLYQIFEQSTHLEAYWKEALADQGIRVLGLADLTAVYSRLFGWQSILDEF